jgi:iron complex outermembrane receptor protein
MDRTPIHIIKKALSLVGLLIFNLQSIYGQNMIKGKVMDSENGVTINNVQIINLENNSFTTSNNLGEFEIPKTGNYLFKKTGYIEKIFEITNSEFIIIQLNLNPSELNEVIVSSNHLPLQLKKSVATINIISAEDIKRSNNTNINAALNRVPGIFMQSGALNTNRITIRGIGSRNLFGTSKIRAYFQDIPLTSGSGNTNIEDFELGSIARIEIIKGAASSIYGAGMGGTIHLLPENAYLNQTTAESELTFGSFGLYKGVLNVNHGTNKHSFRAIYSNTHSDGYRENNEYNRQTFTINSNHFLREKDDINFLASYVDLKAFIPSSVNEDDYINNPKSAAFTWRQSKGYEDSQRGIFGLSWNHQYTNNLKQTTSVFTSFKKSYEPRPFDILTENTSAIGIRSRLIGSTKLFKNNLNWTIGGELFKDTNKLGNFENLYQDFPAGTGSVEGNRFSDFREKRSYYNIFFETNYSLTEKTTLSIGLNFNETSYDLKDRFVDNNLNQSGTYNFGSKLSPKFGVSHLVSNNLSIYSNISHGFSPPSLEETLLPDGLINTNIKPETGWNFEIGSRASLIKNRLQLDVALYRLDIKNLLVARRTGNDQFVGVNAGKTRHDGFEFSLNLQTIQTDVITIKNFISYTNNNFKFKEFIDDTNNYSGNELTGVPSNIFNTGMDIASKIGIYGNINFQHVGSMPITDDNTLFSDSYNLTNIKMGYKLLVSKKLTLNIFSGIDNVFDKAYASQILINATGFGGSAPRYYYPGNPINFYSSVNVNYNF